MDSIGEHSFGIIFTKGISYIANTLGNPLYMDRITAFQQRLAFAKMCVQIEASMEVPRSIEVALKNGTVHVNVVISWLPMKCSTCCVFGHGDKFCPQKTESVPVKVWMPKKVEKEGKDAGVEKGIRIEKDTQQNEDKGKRQMQEVESGSSMKAGSENRFTILDSVMEKDEEVATPKQDAPTEENIRVVDTTFCPEFFQIHFSQNRFHFRAKDFSFIMRLSD